MATTLASVTMLFGQRRRVYLDEIITDDTSLDNTILFLGRNFLNFENLPEGLTLRQTTDYLYRALDLLLALPPALPLSNKQYALIGASVQ